MPLSALRAALATSPASKTAEGDASTSLPSGQSSENAPAAESDSVSPPSSAGKSLVDLLAAQHLEELEAFGEEVAAVLELEKTRKTAEAASTEVPSGDSGGELHPISSSEGPENASAAALVDVGTISAALQTILPKEDALRCLETATGLAGLTQQGHDLALALPEGTQGAKLDISKTLLLLRASSLLKPQKSYDLPGALAWARGQSKIGVVGAGSIGALPDVA